jgi:hypothetical protein
MMRPSAKTTFSISSGVQEAARLLNSINIKIVFKIRIKLWGFYWLQRMKVIHE